VRSSRSSHPALRSRARSLAFSGGSSSVALRPTPVDPAVQSPLVGPKVAGDQSDRSRSLDRESNNFAPDPRSELSTLAYSPPVPLVRHEVDPEEAPAQRDGELGSRTRHVLRRSRAPGPALTGMLNRVDPVVLHEQLEGDVGLVASSSRSRRPRHRQGCESAAVVTASPLRKRNPELLRRPNRNRRILTPWPRSGPGPGDPWSLGVTLAIGVVDDNTGGLALEVSRAAGQSDPNAEIQDADNSIIFQRRS
jgi:hypothetical protein